ncbi:hypothetical protein PJM32_29840, partial [Mycobacterium kansasii]
VDNQLGEKFSPNSPIELDVDEVPQAQPRERERGWRERERVVLREMSGIKCDSIIKLMAE